MLRSGDTHCASCPFNKFPHPDCTMTTNSTKRTGWGVGCGVLCDMPYLAHDRQPPTREHREFNTFCAGSWNSHWHVGDGCFSKDICAVDFHCKMASCTKALPILPQCWLLMCVWYRERRQITWIPMCQCWRRRLHDRCHSIQHRYLYPRWRPLTSSQVAAIQRMPTLRIHREVLKKGHCVVNSHCTVSLSIVNHPNNVHINLRASYSTPSFSVVEVRCE